MRSAKALDYSRPHHAKGAQLGNLEKDFRAHGKAELKRRRRALRFHAALLHCSYKINPGRQSESNFFHGRRSSFLERLATNSERHKSVRRVADHPRRNVDARRRVASD